MEERSLMDRLESLKRQIAASRQPDFNQLLKVFRREKPDRPTFFELIIDDEIMAHFAGHSVPKGTDPVERLQFAVDAHAAAGYDCTLLCPWTVGWLNFPAGPIEQKATRSMNQGSMITDRRSFESYPWPDPADEDYSAVTTVGRRMPAGMRFVVACSDGVLEAAVAVVGYERLCFMIFEDPDLTQAIFDEIGTRILAYYERLLPLDAVGALVSNDDWGFKTQTLFSPEILRKYVFPWHRRFTEACHRHGKPIMLHSCGNLEKVMPDITQDLRFDGKHSFEDIICPVERFYEQWHDRIAIIGGLDVHFLVTASESDIRERAKRLLRLTEPHGGWAVGSGNSIPAYVPLEKYLAMLEAALEY
jgi:uroporphyrinogen decarboxylase